MRDCIWLDFHTGDSEEIPLDSRVYQGIEFRDDPPMTEF